MTWGIDQFGTLGDGTTGSPSSVPVAVAGIDKVADVAVGGAHMVAFGEPQPTVSSVSPDLAPAVGGNTVTIEGTELGEASAVRFGAAEATNIVAVTSHSLTVTAPAGTGTVDVTVVTPERDKPGNGGRPLHLPAPADGHEGLPSSGPASGGTTVTITGTEFTGATSVSFGDLEISHPTVTSSTSITVAVPASVGGIANVVVNNTAGSSPITTKSRFKYAADRRSRLA